MANSSQQPTTQKYLDIYDISNNYIILKDGVVSFVLVVGAMNFGLLAEAEQDATIYSYAALLNSLNYPIQIVIQSQTKDATNYLNVLKKQEEEASSQDKRDRISRYSQFVSNLIQERNVLDKKFFTIVPATPSELGLLSVDSVLPGKTSFDVTKYEKSVILEKASVVLEPKHDHLISQFARIGLYARQLNTQEIIRLFYTNYNPEASEGQEIVDTSQYTTPLVSADLFGGWRGESEEGVIGEAGLLSNQAVENSLEEKEEGGARVVMTTSPAQEPTIGEQVLPTQVVEEAQHVGATNQTPQSMVTEQGVLPTPLPQPPINQTVTMASEVGFEAGVTPSGAQQEASTAPSGAQPEVSTAPSGAQPEAGFPQAQSAVITTLLQPTNSPSTPASNNLGLREDLEAFELPTNAENNPTPLVPNPLTTNQPSLAEQPPQAGDLALDVSKQKESAGGSEKEAQNAINGVLEEVGEIVSQNKPQETIPEQSKTPSLLPNQPTQINHGAQQEPVVGQTDQNQQVAQNTQSNNSTSPSALPPIPEI